MVSTTRHTRSLIAIGIAAALAAGAGACSSSKSSTGASGSSSGGKFTYWSMWRPEEPQAKVLQAAIDKFQTETGTTVKVEFQGRDVSKKIGPAIAAGNAPDMWDQGADSIYATVAASGGALDLTSVLGMQIPGEGKTVQDVIGTKFLDALPKDPSGSNRYTIPYTISSAGLFYNSADPAIQAAMPSPPATWPDFIKVCDALKAKGKACIASDGDLPWENGLTFDYLLSSGGVDFAQLANDKSGAAWDNPAVLTAVKDMEQLVKGGYIGAGYDAAKYPAMETDWAAGKNGEFYSSGSWVTDEISKEIAPGWKSAVMLPPGAKSADSMVFGFAIPKKAKNAAAAEKFIAYFLQKSLVSGISTTAGNITTRADIPAPDELAGMQKVLNDNPARLAYGGIAGDYTDKVYNQNFLDFWHGKMSAEDFIKKMKSDQVTYWKTQS